MASKTFKICFADNLMQSFVTIEGRTVKIKTINGEVLIEANEFEDVKELRDKIYNLVRGTPANVEEVSCLLELCL